MMSMDEQSNPSDVGGDVSLQDLIEAGMIDAGTRLFKTFAGDEAEAILEEDGSILIDGTRFTTPSAAAEHVVAKSAPGTTPNKNGWRWWQFRAKEGAVHELDDLRQQYLARPGVQSIVERSGADRAGPAGMSQERSSHLLKEAFTVLAENGPLHVGEVMRRVEERVTLNDYERSLNKSGQARWVTNVRWYSVDTVRAGWLEKNGARGIWSITPAGRDALSLPVAEFWPQAHQAYLEWQKTHKQPNPTSSPPATESRLEDLDELRTVIEEREGQVWWVNQGTTFELERDGGYLWAPRQTKSGFPVAHHLAVANLRPGDAVLHYANGGLRAVSRVTDDPVEADRPTELPDEAWYRDGFLAHVEYHTFASPIQLQFIPLKLRTPEAGPFTQDGAVKQGYLFQLSDPFVSGLVELLAPEGAVPTSSLRSALRSLDLGPLVLPGAVLTGLSAALDAGKHVILLGPPGTGKTHLAELVGKAATHSHYAAGYLLTTASADWTTFDTIGGYMPNPKNPGELEFQPGVFLEALAADQWVVLDEINRADADKAFGALLTLLSGFDVKLSFRDSAGQRFRLVLSDGRRSRFDAATATYHVGQNWRIIATMNTRDKNSLFALSYAFMRRFSFVYIGPPTADELTRILRSSSSTPAAVSASLRMANEVSIPLGAALLKDIARYISAHDEVEQGIENAVIAYVLPQLEGRETKLVRADLTRLRQALGLGKEVEANWLSAAGVLLGVDGKAPPNATADDASEFEDDIDLAE